jgi:signal transduction histidine kinase
LSVSAEIVKEHGGSIEVSSEPNEGTTFRLIMPIAEDEQIFDEEGA